MPIELLMPALSPTMTEGNLAKWHKKEGDPVKAGDVIAEIETDKATMEFEAADDGTLGRILVPEGTQGVKVNQPIALLLGEDEDASALDKAKPAPAVKPAAVPEAAKAPEPAVAKPAAPPAQPAAAPAAAVAAPKPVLHAGGARIFVSPLARRLAAQSKIDLGQIKGTGPHGRVVKSDVEAAIKKGPVARAAAGPSPIAAVNQSKDYVVALAGNAPYTERPITGMRRTIAKRLTEAKQTIPHFYATIDCDIDALLRVRSEIAEMASTKVSVNDFVIRAAALALRRVPAANASWSDEAILQWDAVNVAVAVALDDGLITPIIKDADKKSLATISAEMRDLGLRARAGKLKLNEFQGGTFSVSNLGMYGVKDFAAVINPPHGCILAVGAGYQRPVVKNGALAVATVMSVTLACDHRVVDGATGAQWLAEFKKIIEHPSILLL